MSAITAIFTSLFLHFSPLERPHPLHFLVFVANKDVSPNRRLGLPWATLGWPLGHAWATQGPPNPRPNPNPSRQRVATPKTQNATVSRCGRYEVLLPSNRRSSFRPTVLNDDGLNTQVIIANKVRNMENSCQVDARRAAEVDPSGLVRKNGELTGQPMS
jgi:hypothetical protein